MDLQRVLKELKEFRRDDGKGFGVDLQLPDESNLQKLIGTIKGPEVRLV